MRCVRPSAASRAEHAPEPPTASSPSRSTPRASTAATRSATMFTRTPHDLKQYRHAHRSPRRAPRHQSRIAAGTSARRADFARSRDRGGDGRLDLPQARRTHAHHGRRQLPGAAQRRLPRGGSQASRAGGLGERRAARRRIRHARPRRHSVRHRRGLRGRDARAARACGSRQPGGGGARGRRTHHSGGSAGISDFGARIRGSAARHLCRRSRRCRPR